MPPWINFDSEGRLFGKPTNEDVGKLELTWRASDSQGANSYYTLEIIVNNINQAPFYNGTVESINSKKMHIA